jgi:hypothetical protein
VLVYFGGLTAISTFVLHKLLGIDELLFYEVFFKTLLFSAIVYALASLYSSLEKKKWTQKRSNIIIRALAVVFAIIGAGYLVFGLGQVLSLELLYANDPTFAALEPHEQEQAIQEAYLFAIAFFISSVVAFIATAGLWRHKKLGWYNGVALVLVQIIAITGFLDEERVRQLLLDETVNEGPATSDLEAVVELIIPVFTDEQFPAACALFHTSSFHMLQTWLRTHHPTLIIKKTRHRRLDHLTSCLHHLLVASSIALLESRHSLAFLCSAYDYSKAVDTD